MMSRDRTHQTPKTGGDTETILAIDYGARRIGLAVRPGGENLVLPAGVIEVRNESDAVEQLARVLEERRPDIVVVGLPIHANMDQAALIKRFTRKLRKSYEGARWRFADETLTSTSATENKREAGLRTRGRSVDAQAAALILENYLQSEKLTSPPHA